MRSARLRRSIPRPSVLLLVLAVAPAAAQAPTRAAAVEPVPLWRVNCGGPAVRPWGAPFLADPAFGPASPGGHVGGETTDRPNATLRSPSLVDGAATRRLYQSYRQGWEAYRFLLPTGAPLPAGDYVVHLHLADHTFVAGDVVRHAGPDLRRFDVVVEGALVLDDFDVAKTFGLRQCAELVVSARVVDGRLDVEAPPGPDPALLNAIEVWPVPRELAPPGPVVGLAAKDGYHRSILLWTAASHPDVRAPFVAGYRVERATSPGGPWTHVATTWAAPARWYDDEVLPGTTYRYRVAAVDVRGRTGPWSPEALATPLDSADSALPVIDLAVDPADLVLLNENIFDDPSLEVPAQVTLGGRVVPATVRYRGSISRNEPKRSWRVKMSPADLLQGREELNLKAFFLDGTLSREPLAARLLAEVGAAVYEDRPVHLRLNGVFQGVYWDTEELDEHWVAARNRAPACVVYEGQAKALGSDFRVLPDPADYAVAYEIKTNESTGHGELIDLIELINDANVPPAEFVRLFADRFDVDGYLAFLAVLALVNDRDHLGHNFYLLLDATLGRWELVSWDNDLAFRYHLAILLPLDFGVQGWAPPIPPYDDWFTYLRTRVLAEDAFRWRYVRLLRELLASPSRFGDPEAGPGSPEVLGGRIDALHDALLADLTADVQKQGWEDDSAFLAGADQLHAFLDASVQDRFDRVPGYLPASPPTSVWINEVLAVNRSADVDELGEPEPWLELFNAAATPLDLGGAFLTDDLGDPTRWPLPAGTVVPAGGHLRVWADGEPADGPLHASFRLATAGGELGLVAADGTTLFDYRHLGPQLADVSEGRRRDGAQLRARLPVPSPGAPNDPAGNLPPLVAWVRHEPAVIRSSDPVDVTCRVRDADGVASATLLYRIDGGAAQSVALVPLGADRYGTQLAALPDGTHVDYWIEALDVPGRTASWPVEAPDEVLAFDVSDAPPSPVRIAEILADNETTIADEAGQFEDWIELWNSGAAPVDLGGAFLTDDFAFPTKWPIPAGTVLAPDGRVLVWADGDVLDGPLHASFGLSKSGESVALFAADGATLLDGFTFGLQTTDVATGRLPDEGAFELSLLDPTPGASNRPPGGGVARFGPADLAANPVQATTADAPRVGQPFTIAVAGASPGASGLALLGAATQLADLGAEGFLLVDAAGAQIVPLATDGAGSGSATFLLPADPALIGSTLYAQARVPGSGYTSALALTLAP